MDLKALANETLRLIKSGTYDAEIQRAIAGTRLYRPGETVGAFEPRDGPLHIEVTAESTLAAQLRLAQENPVALNFASARNPGGGWLGGARAQEESLARASALVPTLESKPDFYAVNRAVKSCLYTDHLIYSPQVPIFRDDADELLSELALGSFITSPAPNQGAIELNTPEDLPALAPTLLRRGRQVLQVAAAHGHRTLILGAWGCGAFRCDAGVVAETFRTLLQEPWVSRAFAHIVFAIIGGRPGQNTFDQFKQRLGS